MYSSQFKARALRVVDQCGGSYVKAARELGVVSERTLRRWQNEQDKPPRKRYMHLTLHQKRRIAQLVKQGMPVTVLAARFGVSVTTVYNIRNASRSKGARSFMNTREHVNVSRVKVADLPDDVDELKRRCMQLQMDNAILEQTIRILKKTPASTHHNSAIKRK